MTTQLASIGTLEPIPAHLEQRMRLVACHYGTDTEDRRALLWALGLVTVTDDPEPEPEPVDKYPETVEETTRRTAAYHAHASDIEAAHTLGISRQAMSQWRRRQHPPLPTKSAGGAHEVNKAMHIKRLRVYTRTTSDAEAARELGIDPSSFKTWRRRTGLPNKWGTS